MFVLWIVDIIQAAFSAVFGALAENAANGLAACILEWFGIDQTE